MVLKEEPHFPAALSAERGAAPRGFVSTFRLSRHVPGQPVLQPLQQQQLFLHSFTLLTGCNLVRIARRISNSNRSAVFNTIIMSSGPLEINWLL